MKLIQAVSQAPPVQVASLDQEQVRQRAFGALRTLLWRIGSQKPVIMFIDDMQWGDADSAKAMFEVLRPPQAPVVLFMGSFRSDEADDSPLGKVKGTTCSFLIGKGCWQMRKGNSEDAIKTFERAWQRSFTNIVVNFHTIAALTWLVTAIRRRVEELARIDTKSANRLRKRAIRLGRRALWLTRLFPGDRPHALREMSLMAEQKGQLRKALRFADESCALAERQRARFEHAQSLLVRGKLARQLSLPEADQQIQLAEQRLADFQQLIESASQINTRRQ